MTGGRITRHSPSLCPHCGHMVNASAAVTHPNASPAPGNMTLCVGCGAMLEYDADLRLRVTSPETQAEVFRQEPAIKRLAERIVRERPVRPNPTGRA